MLQKGKKIAVITVLTISVATALVLVSPNAFLFIVSFFFGEWSASEIRFTVKSTDDDRPIITFVQNSIDYRRDPFMVIRINEVFPDRPKKLKLVWSIEEDPHQWKKELLSLTYGVCPQGFKEVLAAEPLKIGHFYRVSASNVIKKNGPCQYEVISPEAFYKGKQPQILNL